MVKGGQGFTEITAFEAGTMWDHLTVVYDLIESTMILCNYVKDLELLELQQRMLKAARGRAEKLEEVLIECHVTLPPRPPAHAIVTETPASMSDEYVFRRIYNLIAWSLPDHAVAFKVSASRRIRSLFKRSLLEEMDRFEELQRFGLEKNWLQRPPEYHGPTGKGSESLTLAEAAQLWHRLRTRYDTLQFTNYMVNLAGDADLKLIIAKGQSMLRKHIAVLERIATDHALPLPSQPPEAESVGRPLDATTNSYVFRQALRGMQSYFIVHIEAFQQSTTPALRQKLKRLIRREMDVYDRFMAYGQLRGWVLEQPVYRA